jgi:hypothetical protein
MSKKTSETKNQYLVTFQDRVKKVTIEADNESEASVKAYNGQKAANKLMVISAKLLTPICFLLFILLCSFQDVEPTKLKITWQLIVAFIAGFYEVVVRLIPTVANFSWIGKIIDILKWISDFLNRKKKK